MTLGGSSYDLRLLISCLDRAMMERSIKSNPINSKLKWIEIRLNARWLLVPSIITIFKFSHNLIKFIDFWNEIDRIHDSFHSFIHSKTIQDDDHHTFFSSLKIEHFILKKICQCHQCWIKANEAIRNPLKSLYYDFKIIEH